MILGLPDEGYSRNASWVKFDIHVFLLLSLGRYIYWWTISPQSIVPLAVSVSTLTLFIWYILLLKFTVL